MADAALIQEISDLVARANTVPEGRKYWLVRTQGGSYFKSFLDYGFIGLGYDEIKNSEIVEANKGSKDDIDTIVKLKTIAEKKFSKSVPNGRFGLIANQIFKFAYEIKRGDVVIIPSYSSSDVALGVVQSTPLMDVTPRDIVKTGCPFLKRKKIQWKKTEYRYGLDPGLQRALQAHQAINDINSYSESIEKTLGNFYIKAGVGNLILDVETNDKINARRLFSLGHYLMDYSHTFIDRVQLPFDINAVEVKINLNSKGKIHLKAPDPRIIWLIAVLFVGVSGGGLRVKWGSEFNLDLSTGGVVQKIIDYQNNEHDRAISRELIKDIDSLKIKSPDDVIKLQKQFAPNKDLPK